MTDKQQLLTMLRDEYNRWEALLGGLSEPQITARQLPSNLSIQDVMAHLWAWQQRSVARLEAAVEGHAPVFPKWPENLDPETEGEPYELNAWIHETSRDKPWSTVYREWRDGFRRLIALSEAVPEKDLLEVGHYAWLEGHPLAFILEATCEHHHIDHREPLTAWLREQGLLKPGS